MGVSGVGDVGCCAEVVGRGLVGGGGGAGPHWKGNRIHPERRFSLRVSGFDPTRMLCHFVLVMGIQQHPKFWILGSYAFKN